MIDTNKKLRIVFMGTPDFAVASLKALHDAGYEIAAVITAPDKPAGRGMKLQQSAVKQYAAANNIHVLQPEKLKNQEFLQSLKALQAKLFVVVAFRMLPEVVFNMPPLGTINLHGSLLPQYRGAAPINWAIINGETETGVTTFKLQQAIDTGNILLQEKILISEDETAGELHDVMKEVGAKLLIKTLNQLSDNTLQEVPQSTADNLKHAPKIFTDTCNINWQQTTNEVHNLIRGLSPYPAAFTKLDDKLLKIYKSKKEITTHGQQPGNIITDNKTFLKFATADGFIYALDVQLEGKKRMQVTDFLRGYHVTATSQ